MVSSLVFLLLLLFATQQLCDGKVTSGDFRLNGLKSEYILGSFAILPDTGGRMSITLSSKQMYENESTLKIHAYRDTEWSLFQNDKTCHSKIFHAKRVSSTINFNYNRETMLWESRIELNIISRYDKEGQYDHDAKIDDGRSHYWYFVIDDCSLEEYYQDNKIPQVHYTMEMMNYEDHHGTVIHYSADEVYLEWCHTIVTIISLIVFLRLLVFNVLNKMLGWGSDNGGKNNVTSSSIHVAVIWITIASGFDCLSSILEQIHLDIYYYDGVGSYTLDALAAHCEAICDAFLSLFLLAIGSGWTLPDSVIIVDSTATAVQKFMINIGKQPISSLVQFNNSPAAIFGCIIVLLHMVLAQWGRTYNDDHESYHNFHHLPGKVLMVVRMIFGLLFYIACYQTQQHFNMNVGTKQLKEFYHKMSIVGLLWFLSLPGITFICNWFIPYYQRLPFVTFSSAIAQNLCIVTLSWLVTAGGSSAKQQQQQQNQSGSQKSSAYHQFSTITGNVEKSLTDLTASASSNNKNNAKTSWSLGKAKVRAD